MFGIDVLTLIETAGYIGLTFIAFAETGLFFGFFFPGDSLLFSAGLLASQGIIHLWPLIPLLMAAAILGDTVGYWTGEKFGGWLKKRQDTWFYKKKHLKNAQDFYDKHGGKTIFLARFIPIVRTFAPIVAGLATMTYPTFLSFNVIGGLVWVTVMTLAGYFLGSSIPNIDQYLLPVLSLIVFVSLLPAIWGWIKNTTLTSPAQS